jgi:hypothetical protein
MDETSRRLDSVLDDNKNSGVCRSVEAIMIFAANMPGMEWIPVILVSMSVNGLCGLASVFASLFFPRSMFGYRAGLASLLIGALSVPVFLCVIGRHLYPVGYVFIAAPSLLGGLGLMVYATRRSRALPWLRIGISAITLVILGVLFRCWYIARAAEQEMLALVSGNERAAIVAFEIDGQQRLVECTDRAVCEYLTVATRQARRGKLTDLGKGLKWGGAGVYTFALRFASGYTFNVVRTDPYKNGLVLSVDPVELGWPTHEVRFPDPIPERLTQILEFLGKKCEDVAGEVLILADGQPPTYYYYERLSACRRAPPKLPAITSRRDKGVR